MDKKVMSITELSSVLGISRPTAYKLASSNGFPLITVGKRKLVPIKDFELWLNRRTIGNADEEVTTCKTQK